MSGLLDGVTISGGKIVEHLSSSHATNQSSQSLISSRLYVPSHVTLFYLLPLSILMQFQCPLSTAESHGEPYHASSYTVLFLGSTGSNWRYAVLCNSCSRKGNTDQVGVFTMQYRETSKCFSDIPFVKDDIELLCSLSLISPVACI